jgi:hypothetical protein
MFKLPRLFLNQDAFNKGGEVRALYPYIQRNIRGNRNTLTLVAIAIFTIINPSVVRALDITNGDFDTDFSGWMTTGQTRVLDSQAFLETCYFDAAGGGCNEDIRLTDFTGLQAFLSTIPNNLNIKEGSAIKQEITASAGEILTFSWNFLTNEELSEDYNDFAFFTLGDHFEILADTQSNDLSDDFFSGFNRSTGVKTFSYTIPTTGTYTLGFGVVDVGPDSDPDGAVLFNSALQVDSIRGLASTPVPEPYTILGILTAFSFGAKLKRGVVQKPRRWCCRSVAK